MRISSIAVSMLILGSVPASAMNGVLENPGSDMTWVWKDKASFDEALSLIEAGAHKTQPMLVLQHVACLVPNGTAVIVTDAGFATHDILVIDGENAGCRGNIPREHFKVTNF